MTLRYTSTSCHVNNRQVRNYNAIKTSLVVLRRSMFRMMEGF